MGIAKQICSVIVILGLVSCGNTRSEDTSSYTIVSGQSASNNLQLVRELPPPDNTRNGADVLLAAGDILEIDVFQVNDLDKTVQVNSLGNVSLPLVGTVTAVGKTVSTFEQELETAYGGKYLQSPEITVFVKESFGQKVTLDGEFSQPGIYTVSNNASLIQVVALAHGLSALDEEKIFIYREINGRRFVANQNLKAIRSGRAENTKIFGGDIIIAFTSDQKIASQKLREALGVAVSAARIATPF